MGEHLAIHGGTFDPIHMGHLAIAEDARWQLGLDRVFFVPAARQPLKEHSHVATATDRLAMVRLATSDNATFAVCDLEVRRGGRSYTVDTVAALRAEYPTAEFTFLAGADVIADLHRWYEIERLLSLCRFAFIARPGYVLDLDPLYAAIPIARDRVTTMAGPGLEISASELRSRRERGAPIRYQVPDAVLDYLEAHGLYRVQA